MMKLKIFDVYGIVIDIEDLIERNHCLINQLQIEELTIQLQVSLKNEDKES